IDDPTEATMHAATISDTAAPRYGDAPQVMFAATRAGAERRAREAAAAAALDRPQARSAQHLIRRLATRLGASLS
ncbi:MAG: hypothetical protein ACXWEL_07790, partial [Solirubrobacterales bacterium]